MKLHSARTGRAVAALLAAVGLCVAGAPGTATATPDATATARAALRAGTLAQAHGVNAVCASQKLACLAQVVTVSPTSSEPLQTATPLGYGATELASAYGLSGAPATHATIAVIGAGAYPALAADLAVYRSQYGLPACTVASGCLRQVRFDGSLPYKPARHGFGKYVEESLSVETALDAQMASAACPSCRIVSVQIPWEDALLGSRQAYRAAILHFALGVQTARKLGASAVSISYGYPTTKYSDAGKIAAMMTQPGMALVSSSGDYGFMERYGQWPQSLPTVTSAGGTSLYPQGNSRGYLETAWNGAGSDCTPDLPPAVGQPAAISALCGGVRTASDVSAVADPYTGVAVYDSYSPFFDEPLGWIVVGGTSAASPLIAGMYARSGDTAGVIGPNTLYAASASAFNDVTIGTNSGLGYCPTVGIGNAVCDSGPGWDGPTGLGTPAGLAAFSS